jgi:hypothetical protein
LQSLARRSAHSCCRNSRTPLKIETLFGRKRLLTRIADTHRKIIRRTQRYVKEVIHSKPGLNERVDQIGYRNVHEQDFHIQVHCLKICFFLKEGCCCYPLADDTNVNNGHQDIEPIEYEVKYRQTIEYQVLFVGQLRAWMGHLGAKVIAYS